MTLKIIQMVLPIVLLLAIGLFCRKRQIITQEGLAGIKSVISNICLPVVLFNAFFTAKYSLRIVWVFLFVYAGYAAALALGFALKKLAGKHGKFYPFLLASAEGGMLGYALYGILMGEQTGFAAVDLGQTVFAYTAFLGLLTMTDGQKLSPKKLAKNMFTNKCFLGMLLGIILGALGIGQIVINSAAGGIVTSAISFLTAPTSALVLLMVGYELEFEKSLIKPVVVTVISRLLIMAALFAAVNFVLFRIIPFDKSLQTALLILYALPAPFIIPIFANVGKEGKYISTSLSVETLCTIILFIAISAYTLA